ncbi:ABC transporter ATP-binding protein [Paenibacillus apiarius]|uniref:ABC transporter ATP-binding protein n=1 Tax=Paenibacillus apiarius TaxID=46240 RepID=A0ABT4DLD3_9BACL|nr:ABC transporter ATP-binding protein [Paenibacillus apiarius]MBN3525991.1 ABC transporter ATP-binding protein [Paenibacillus apiarius]MCY9513616.1 ABC transporter ATP-binding protein [Paenibacillus apiarius]MCY9518167.1 ABC transporter ATP-binding protein [Paenibacillus apiarius]MCY9551432.1 ABC transporter ATP-binding protein [Paenibacillus apiarius]MCY9558586.1 ABC transporter ATP-binding protein [Paenibacillus apiarius]
MKWLRKRKQTASEEATPVLAANEQKKKQNAQDEAEYIEDNGQSAVWPARAVPVVTDELLLDVRGVERTFQVGSEKLHVLKGIDMAVRPGQLVMLKGRSGSGKTTLLNMLGGLDLPTKGDILFRGDSLSSWSDNKRTVTRRNDIGFIFQAFALMPLLSAYENVELSLRMANIPRHLWKARVQHCLEMVGLGKRMKHRPYEMSGGEQQRVAIAKAIAHKPLLLLADEPTAELDSQMGAQVMGVFRQILRTENIAICMTTHDPTILEVADHVYEMVDGKFIS